MLRWPARRDCYRGGELANKKKLHRKPTGTAGGVRFGAQEEPRFQPVTLATTKAEIERQIVEWAMRTGQQSDSDLRALYRLRRDPVQNERENDFDFTLDTTSGTEFLDLMEVAPLGGLGGSYQAVSLSYLHGERAEPIYEDMLRKAQKYGIAPRCKIHLLLYATDWRLRICSGVLDLLRFWAARRDHCFETIAYFAPEGSDRGELRILFPAADDAFVGFDEAHRRRWETAMGDLANPGAVEGGFEVKLGALKKPEPGGGARLEIRQGFADGGILTTFARMITSPAETDG